MKAALTINETVEALGGTVSRTTIWRCCRNGSIPAKRVGNRWVIPAYWVEDLVERPRADQHL